MVDTIASASAAMVNSAVVISPGDDESVKSIPTAAVSHTGIRRIKQNGLRHQHPRRRVRSCVEVGFLLCYRYCY